MLVSTTRIAVTQQEALQWIATLFDDSVERITPVTTRASIAGWDSMGTLMLLADLDEKFNVHVPEEQLESMNSVSDILAILSQNGALQA
jgi:acyl carrier protein